MQKVPKINQKSAKTLQKLAFLCLLGRCTDFPDWFQTGSRLVPNLPKAVLKFAESGVRFQFFGCQKNALFRAETG